MNNQFLLISLSLIFCSFLGCSTQPEKTDLDKVTDLLNLERQQKQNDKEKHVKKINKNNLLWKEKLNNQQQQCQQQLRRGAQQTRSNCQGQLSIATQQFQQQLDTCKIAIEKEKSYYDGKLSTEKLQFKEDLEHCNITISNTEAYWKGMIFTKQQYMNNREEAFNVAFNQKSGYWRNVLQRQKNIIQSQCKIQLDEQRTQLNQESQCAVQLNEQENKLNQEYQNKLIQSSKIQLEYSKQRQDCKNTLLRKVENNVCENKNGEKLLLCLFNQFHSSKRSSFETELITQAIGSYSLCIKPYIKP